MTLDMVGCTEPGCWDLVIAKVGFARVPVPMVLHCPSCGEQHIDAPELDKGWTNPPHRSHLCHACGTVWRPADIQTTGVPALKTRGAGDSWPPSQPKGERMTETEALETPPETAPTAEGTSPDATGDAGTPAPDSAGAGQ
jgi:hypothetical protein